MLYKTFRKMTHFIAWNNKIDVPVELSIHSTFNVAKLSPFYVGDDFSDSRTNPEEGDCKCFINPPHLNGVKVILFIIK